MYSIVMGFSFPIFLKTIKLFVWKFFQLYACLKTKKTVAKFSDDYKVPFKYLKFLRILITWVFFIHFFRIVYRESVETTVYSAHIKNNVHTLYFPVVGFCFNFVPKKMTLNYLDGHKLEEMSRNLTVDSLFHRISYIDHENQQQYWESGDEFSENLIVKTNYYKKKKCFEFHYDLNVKDLNLNKHNFGLRIKLKDDLKFNTLTYYTKSNKYKFVDRYYSLKLNKFYQIFFDQYRATVKDKYQGFRNPLFWILNPVKIRSRHYLTNLRKDFERTKNHSTLLLPLTEESFNLTIRNDLFEKYCEEEVSEREKYAIDIEADYEIYRDFIGETYNNSHTFNFSKRIFSVHQVGVLDKLK